MTNGLVQYKQRKSPAVYNGLNVYRNLTVFIIIIFLFFFQAGMALCGYQARKSKLIFPIYRMFLMMSQNAQFCLHNENLSVKICVCPSQWYYFQFPSDSNLRKNLYD